MITNNFLSIPQAIQQANAQDNTEANPRQNFDKIRNPILKTIANNLGNNELRQQNLTYLSNESSEVFKSFVSSILETEGEENKQVIDLYHTLNHNKMLNGHSFKNFILMDKNIKKYILDKNRNNQRQLFTGGVQSGLLTVALSLGSMHIGAPWTTGCAAGLFAGGSIICVNQVGSFIDHVSNMKNYEEFIGPVADTQPPYQNPNYPLVRNYLFTPNGAEELQNFLSRSTTPAVRLGSRWSNPLTEPSQQNSMSESQPNPSTAPRHQNSQSNESGLPISLLQSISVTNSGIIRSMS